jgi:tripeptide aminopeptidase
MHKPEIQFTCTERFLRYVKIDTQSDHNSSTFPSTEKQKDLGRILVQELHDMGVYDAEMDEHGYVYATLESNSDKAVPVICLCSHMDTSPDASGKNVNPVVHRDYQGGDILLPNNPSQSIRASEHPELVAQIGNDIITADGTTLLGADNKAGVAEIMDAVHYFASNPEIRHGKIRILFTPDEEVGRGVEKVDMKKLGADIGYTIDGADLGSVQNETFSADSLTLTVTGFNIHPGFAKDKLENAIKITAAIIERLPKDTMSPETTSGKEGFVSPVSISGNVDSVKLKFIIRDFDNEKLIQMEDHIRKIAAEVVSNFKQSKAEITVEQSYRNLKEVLDKDPKIVEYALEAVSRAGITPRLDSIRGGTDGSRLSFMGLPCPNIFAGEHAFHSVLEWVSIQDMQKAVETIVNLCMIWEERS